MALYLNVPYSEKEEAKALGAMWDSERKSWFAINKYKYLDFRKWISNDEDGILICDFIYIIEAVQTCFKCKNKTKVICLGIDTYYYLSEANRKSKMRILSGKLSYVLPPVKMPDELKLYLKEKYNFYYGYSNFAKSSYFGNHCQHCGVLQGDFFLFEEPSSPFYIMSHQLEKAKNITVYKIPLIVDGVTELKYQYVKTSGLIEKHSKYIDLKELKIRATDF